MEEIFWEYINFEIFSYSDPMNTVIALQDIEKNALLEGQVTWHV